MRLALALCAALGLIGGLVFIARPADAQVRPTPACSPAQPCNSASVSTGRVTTPFVDAGNVRAGLVTADLVDAGALYSKVARVDVLDAGVANVRGDFQVQGFAGFVNSIYLTNGTVTTPASNIPIIASCGTAQSGAANCFQGGPGASTNNFSVSGAGVFQGAGFDGGSLTLTGRADIAGISNIGGVSFNQNGIVQGNPLVIMGNSGNVNDTSTQLTLAGSGTPQDAGYLTQWWAGSTATYRAFGIYNDGSPHWQISATLEACRAGLEGLVSRDILAGGTTGKRTKLCLCTSDGAGSPAYAWQNLATGTVGTDTTCGTE